MLTRTAGPRHGSATEAEWRATIAKAFADVGFERRAARRESIYLQGDPATAAFAVKSGCVELARSSSSGREVTHVVHFNDEAFGFADLLLGKPRTFNATALADTVIWVVPAQPFMGLLDRDPGVTRAMLSMVLYRNMTLAERKPQLMGTSAERRVVAALERFAVVSSEASEDVPVVKLTHEQIGRLCHLTRQTVTGVLAKLTDQGLLRIRSRHVELIDLAGLREMMDLAD
ncbi:Crp/Fnr family transcriptional regulator [Jiangella asiatica]|uniref:Crp/Fnr family transcriptional regulator n=1 Tax=Jiangella asiatica TaxID=2530372 RepID=A0A4R5CPC8_9ACTN|nr:Crp/Fnr family transcriptional regulator [Jiangella asiatica]TDE01160.1 Crp/Fnr family transcriptional regulator [Jiangella asiatica]